MHTGVWYCTAGVTEFRFVGSRKWVYLNKFSLRWQWKGSDWTPLLILHNMIYIPIAFVYSGIKLVILTERMYGGYRSDVCISSGFLLCAVAAHPFIFLHAVLEITWQNLLAHSVYGCRCWQILLVCTPRCCVGHCLDQWQLGDNRKDPITQ